MATKKSTYKSGSKVENNTPLSIVNDRFTRARDYRVSTQDDIWERSYNNWKGVLDQSIYPWRSKLFIPWSFTVVETIIPKIFAREPKWRAISRNPDFNEDSDRVVQDLLTYQWKRMGMRLKMYDYIKDALVYGKGYAKISWNFQTKTKTIKEPVVGENDEITFETRRESEIVHDDPKVDIIDPIDIYVDPDATCLEDATYVIHRKTATIDELKDNPNYKNVNKIESGEYAEQYMDKLFRYNDATPEKDKHKDLVEILEYWEADRLIVVANRGIVLRDDPNPFHHKMIPFVELDDYRDPHSYYGHSELSVIDPLQREINAIRNQRRDYDNLALNPVILQVPGTLRNPNSAVMAPGSVWSVSDLDSIDVLQLPLLQGAASDIETMTAEDIQRTVAIDEIGIGLLPDNPQRRSATEVMTAQSMAGKRFALKVALLEEAVRKMGQMVFALNQQFLDAERMIQIVGEDGATEWVQLSPQDIRGDFFVDIEVGSMLPRDEITQRQEAVELLQYITPLIGPIVQTDPRVVFPIIRSVIETFELPNRQEILDELKQTLEGAAETVQEQNAVNAETAEAQAAQSQAAAISQLEQPAQGDVV